MLLYMALQMQYNKYTGFKWLNNDLPTQNRTILSDH